MINNFVQQMQAAVAERRAAPTVRGIPLIVVAMTGCTLAYIALAMVLIPPDQPIELHFVSEKGAVTALSAFFLTAASAFSLATTIALFRAGDRHTWVWIILALGFAFLAFDEMLEFHERIGALIERFLSVGVFRGWNDIIVILYGVVALPVVVALLPALMRWRFVTEMFATAFVFYAAHTLIDSVSEPPSSFSIILEESAKLLSGTFLVIGTIAGLTAVLWRAESFRQEQKASE